MFAVLFIPDFPAEAVARAAPELRDQALAIVDGTPPLLDVVACNERARQAGVELGMTKLEAEGRLSASVAPGSRLAGPVDRGTAHDWSIRRRCLAQETAAHSALIDCACAFSPRVEADASHRDTVVLDLGGLERLFGPPATIARELARHASEMGLEVNVAVAANIEAANYAARAFAGITVIPPGQEAERLSGLCIDILLACHGDAPDMLETLDRWGVRTFRAFAALPETAVAQRLGAEGVRLQKLARGEGARPLAPAAPPLQFKEAVELEYPVVLLEPLAFVLHGMLEQLCARLSARALRTNELRLRLQTAAAEDDDSINAAPQEKPGPGFKRLHTDQTSEIKQQKSKIKIAPVQISNPNCQLAKDAEYVLRLPVPMRDAKTFLKLLQLELRARPPLAPVEKVFLRAEPVEPRFTQGGLFLPTAPEPEKLELTLARINAVVNGGEKRVGISDVGIEKDAVAMRETTAAATDKSPQVPNPKSQMLLVGAAELLDTHRPDAFRMKTFAPAAPGIKRNSSGHDPLDTAPRERQSPQRETTVFRRFRPPLAAHVELREDVPVRLSISDFRFSVSDLSNSAAPPTLAQITNHKSQIINVLWAAGPWRESGEWWSEQTWQRETWDIALQHDGNTAVYRIFRDDFADQWWVEAEYD